MDKSWNPNLVEFEMEQKKCYGQFHDWVKKIENNNEVMYAVVEDAKTGNMLELKFDLIRFLSSKEVSNFVMNKAIGANEDNLIIDPLEKVNL